MTDAAPPEPFFLIVADLDHLVFAVEGPMTDRAPWNQAVDEAGRRHQRRIHCGPTGADRDALRGVPAEPRLPRRAPGQHHQAAHMSEQLPAVFHPTALATPIDTHVVPALIAARR